MVSELLSFFDILSESGEFASVPLEKPRYVPLFSYHHFAFIRVVFLQGRYFPIAICLVVSLIISV